MLMSIDKCFDAWMPAMRFALGRQKAFEAQRKMRPIIERAQQAEREGRIKDMQPLMAMCNPTKDIKDGFWRLEIRFSPIEDGKPLPPRSWITTILQPEDDDDRPSASQAREAVQG